MALGCEQTSCLAELGGALGVRYLIVPSVGKIGASYLINLKLVDVEAVLPLWRDRREITKESDLVGAVGELSQSLHVFRHPQAAKSALGPIALGVVGALLAGSGAGHFWLAKRRYEDLPSRSNYEAAQVASQVGDPLVAGGLLTSLVGVVWWVMQ